MRNAQFPFVHSQQGTAKIDNWGSNIHVFIFTGHENNQFQKKLIMYTLTYEYCPPPPNY